MGARVTQRWPNDSKSRKAIKSSHLWISSGTVVCTEVRGEDTRAQAVRTTFSVIATEFHISLICAPFGTPRCLTLLSISLQYLSFKVFSFLHCKTLGRAPTPCHCSIFPVPLSPASLQPHTTLDNYHFNQCLLRLLPPLLHLFYP